MTRETIWRDEALAGLHLWQYPKTEQDCNTDPESIIRALPSASTDVERAAVALADAVVEAFAPNEDELDEKIGGHWYCSHADIVNFDDVLPAYRAAKARQGE